MDHITIEKHGSGLLYEVQLRSDIGGRDEQQDSAYAYTDDSTAFAIVCDGMGGTEDGGQASRIAVDAMRELLNEYLEKRPRCGAVEFLQRSMLWLDAQVTHALGRRRGGTTAVAVILQKEKLYWFSVGDSRLYVFRNGELVQATRDHNYFLRLNEQLQNGEISREFYEQESTRGEALISFLGVGGFPVYDLTNVPLELMDGDILLLTSDGLYKAIHPELILHILRSNDSLEAKADKLMAQITVLKNTVALDNTTFALLKIDLRGSVCE